MMRRILLLLAFSVSALAGGTMAVAAVDTAPAKVPAAPTRWQPPSGLTQIPLWPNGVPDMAGVAQPGESVEIKPDSIAGLPATMIHDVAVPTMTVMPPKGRNSGAAMIVFPGGGFQILAIDLEGTEVCDWITAHGMTCILLKYRVPKSDTYGEDACHCQVTPKVLRALQDAQRAIRLTRAKAQQWHIDPTRIGVIGFSAGGYLVAQTSNIFPPAYTPVDAIDRISSRPDFAVAAYPGHLCRSGGLFDPSLHVSKRTPPTFLVQNWDDQTDDICNSILYARALGDAGVPAEVHLFARGDHAFAFRHIGHPVEMWRALLARWLKEIGIL